jgi:hypothetical protein
MNIGIRISKDAAGNQRYTEDTIKRELKNENVLIQKSGAGNQTLLIRKTDGAVLGEFTFHKKNIKFQNQ